MFFSWCFHGRTCQCASTYMILGLFRFPFVCSCNTFHNLGNLFHLSNIQQVYEPRFAEHLCSLSFWIKIRCLACMQYTKKCPTIMAFKQMTLTTTWSTILFWEANSYLTSQKQILTAFYRLYSEDNSYKLRQSWSLH